MCKLTLKDSMDRNKPTDIQGMAAASLRCGSASGQGVENKLVPLTVTGTT